MGESVSFEKRSSPKEIRSMGVQPMRGRKRKRLLQQTQLKLAIEETQLCFYDRLFTPAVTLWCMIFQRLNHDHTLQAAVSDLHSGGRAQAG